jgi:ABC-type proline/glycine betaine transport system ATPase subunit
LTASPVSALAWPTICGILGGREERVLSGLSLRDVRKAFGAIPILDGITLDTEDREFIAFLGPSGSGKSTLLRIIAGLETADSGEVLLDGRRIDQLPPGDRGVAMVFQAYALYPHMSVRDNMAFGLRNAKLPEAEISTRIADASRMVSASGSRSAGRSSNRPSCSCSTSHYPTLMPRFAYGRGSSWRNSASGSTRWSSWSPMTRPRR